MLARTVTHALVGLEARPVEVEAHLQRGVPGFSIVGLPDKACQEAKERSHHSLALGGERPGRRCVRRLRWPRAGALAKARTVRPRTGSGRRRRTALAERIGRLRDR